MRDLLDPENIWIGTPGRALSGIKKPVAATDSLTISSDSGPVLVDVLANDVDYAGGGLTIVSANAALGTAWIESGQVAYQPIAGLTVQDTVVYTIEDTNGGQNSGQIDVTVNAPPIQVTVTGDSRLEVTSDIGSVDVTVTAPAEFAATSTIIVSDFLGGPVNMALPAISGTHAEGQTLNANSGLWAYDVANGSPTRSLQWRDASGDIAGATGETLSLDAALASEEITVVETLSDSAGTRSAETAVSVPSLSPENDVALIGWWDASDPTTISGGPTISGWTDKLAGVVMTASPGTRYPTTGTRTLNGRNVIDFDGTEYLEAAQTLPTSGDVAFHMACVIDSVDNQYVAALAVEAANDFQIDANDTAAFLGRLNVAGIGSTINLSGGPFSGGLIISAVFDRTGTATAEVYIGGTLRGSIGYSTPIDSVSALHIMTNRSKNIWLDGAVAEVIVTGNVTNRATHHAYLATKWGLS